MSDDETTSERHDDLLRSNEALRRELTELREQHARLSRELGRLLVGHRAARESRRAALNLLEDAIAARRAATHENEERRRVEEALREANRNKDELLAAVLDSELRRKFLLELSDRLRALADPRVIMAVAAKMLGRHLGVACTRYLLVASDSGGVEVAAEYDDGSAQTSARERRASVSDELPGVAAIREGDEVYLDDIEQSTARVAGSARVRAACAVPVLDDGRVVMVLEIRDTRPRGWSEADRHLVRGVAERTWVAVERARADVALRVSLDAATAARAESEAANRAKDEFLAMLSHELRTPLASISLWVGAVQSGAVPAQDLSRALEAIAGSTESLSHLIEDLLDLSRLASGKLVLARSSVDVVNVAKVVIDMVRPMAAEKGISLHHEIAPELGRIIVDEGRLKQILGNLLTNATKFTGRGGHILLCVRRLDADLVIEVSDDGEGIAAEFMPHVFEKFRQADMAETRRHMGLGIGLALTKQLVELHGGTIQAESAGLGHGSTFTVRIRWTEDRQALVAERTHAPVLPSSLPLAGLQVLLVEDDANTREAMERMLSHLGAVVVPAASVEEALALELGRSSSDVIVSDVGLPGKSGLELIERIAADCESRGRRRPAACAVSAHAREIDRKRAIEAGFDMYLTKPVGRDQLIEAVTDLRDILRSQHG